MKDKVISFIAGMLFMITFGLIDNLFLFMGMDWIDSIIPMNSMPQLAAMWGNTISDIIGAVAGVIIALIFKKMFNVKASEHILVEIIGVLIGCLIPIIIFMLWI